MRTDTPIAFRPSSLSTLDVSTNHPSTGPPIVSKKNPPKSYSQRMAPRHKVQSRKSAPASDKTPSTRNHSVSDRSDHSDSASDHTKANDQQDKGKSTRKRASKPKVRTGELISCSVTSTVAKQFSSSLKAVFHVKRGMSSAMSGNLVALGARI